MLPINVVVSHDVTEGVWFVESSDIPGLNAEAQSYEALIEVVLDVAPELIAANLKDGAVTPDIPVWVQHKALVKRAAAG